MLKLHNDKAEIEDGGKLWFECGCGCKFSFKVVEIGDWNMLADASKNVAHGLDLAKIVTALCCITDDAGAKKYQTMGHDGGFISLEVDYIDATNIVLKRKTGSIFESTDFDSTSYNRGFITIMHK